MAPRTLRLLWWGVTRLVCVVIVLLAIGCALSLWIETKFHDSDDKAVATLQRMRRVGGVLCEYEHIHRVLPAPDVDPLELFGPSVAMGHGPGDATDPRENLVDSWGHRLVIERVPEGLRIVSPQHAADARRLGLGDELAVTVSTSPSCHIE